MEMKVPAQTSIKRSKRRAVIAALITAAILFALILLAQRLRDRIYDAYAAEWVSGLIISHLRTHDGQWPADWNDLNEQLQAHRYKHGGWSLEDLQRRVEVNFQIDPANFIKDPRGAVRLRSGRTTHFDDWEPNQTIARYLREHPSTRPTTRPL